MKRTVFLLSYLWALSCAYPQEKEQVVQMTYDLDSTVLFIDNTTRHWYTFEIEADTFLHIQDNMFLVDKKTCQVVTLPFHIGKTNGVKGSVKAEKFALKQHMKWEVDYQETTLGKKFRKGKEFYFVDGKPFLIWWMKTPETDDASLREIDFELDNAPLEGNDTSAHTSDVTHQLYLDFVVQGNRTVSVSFPVFEEEKLKQAIFDLKIMAGTINVYGGPVDVNALISKLENKGRYFFSDSLGLVNMEIPAWMNITYSGPGENYIVGTCPELENVHSAIGIRVGYSNDSTVLNRFNNRELPGLGGKYEEVKLMEDNPDAWRYFYKSKEGYFWCENIYILDGPVIYFINYTATEKTYEHNKPRLKEIIRLVKNAD